MSSKTKFELLKDAYEIIDGIPDENFKLFTWRMTDEGPTCGTIACAAGWLTLHPKFAALGLEVNGDSYPKFDGRIGYPALAAFFGINENNAERLFGARENRLAAHLVQPSIAMSDKTLFLLRVKKFLERHNQLHWQLMDAAFAARDRALDTAARRKFAFGH